ncbi:MAG: tetratricopeptide repeat protein [Pyrinomonadaceae bacterium]
MGPYFGRQFDQAIKNYHKALEMEPGFGVAHMFLGTAYAQLGRYEEAISALQKAIELTGGSALTKAMLGHVYAAAGDLELARKMVADLEQTSGDNRVPSYNVALIYAGLGETDTALHWLEEAYKQRAVFLAWINAEPMFDNLRLDSRFADLVKRIGLEPQTAIVDLSATAK